MSHPFDTIYQRLMGNGALPFYETTLRGRNTFKYRAEFERTQWLSPDALAALQWERLSALLRHAFTTVEAYRAMFDALNATPDDIRTPDDFARLPVLDKATIKASKDRLISSRFPRRDLVASATGGSTGSPMQFYYNRDSYERRTAAAMRGDGWAGWQLCAPEFYIWGTPLLPESGFLRRKKLLHHRTLRRYAINSFKLTSDHIGETTAKYNRARPRVVIGYANAVYEFAAYVRQAGIPLHRPLGVITSAEKLYPHQRQLIEETFGARVFERYGCRETMMVGAECAEHAGLHAITDNLYIEIARDGVPCGPGELGDVLLTDLHNYGMPLIRYRVGDTSSWKGEACPCGRGLPLLNPVEGRTLDMISTPSGRVVSGVFFPHLLKDFPAIRTYQIVQETRDRLQVSLSLEEPLSESQETFIRETIHRLMGPEMTILWKIGTDVVVEKTPKFRPVLSRVPVDLANGVTEPELTPH